MNIVVKILLKGTVGILAVPFCFAQVNSSTKPGDQTYLEAIQTAQSFSLEKNRQAATKTLIKSLQKEAWGSQEQRELLDSLDQLSRLFYTEDAQKAFHLAESLYFSGSSNALKHYQEAMAQEPSNLQVLLGVSRTHLSRGDCEPALETLEKASSVHPYAKDVLLLKGQALHCQNDETGLEGLLTKSEHLDETLRNRLEIPLLFRKAKIREANKKLAHNLKVNPQDAESLFWMWKVNVQSSPTKAIDSAQKYIGICKNLTPKVRRSYREWPSLCKNQNEVEKYLESANSVSSQLPTE